ncbi:hypothetical protein N431DRAFT_484424 [Stipitochalara longipes BDJ]|nr:hypothetical protein N431DRAFT_484424 [Stipitochalara longipes BDJ]
MSSARGRERTAPLTRGKRKITEARKEQNRIAQQVYRQRQKERLSLGRKPSSGLLQAYHDLKPRQALGTYAYAGQDLPVEPVEAGKRTLQQIQSPANFDLHSHENTTQSDHTEVLIDCGSDLRKSIPDFNCNSEGLLSSPVVPVASSPLTYLSMLYNSTNCSDAPSQIPGLVYDMNRHADLENELHTFDSTNLDWNISQAPSTTSDFEVSVDSILIGYYYPQHNLQNLTCNGPNDIQKSRIDSTDADLCQVPGVDALVSAVSNFVNSRQFRPSIQHPPLPDPYSNTLYCIQTLTLLPYLHNARCIGLEIQDLIAMKSPFYRPNTTMADDPTSLLIEARKPWIPAHLQPTLPQILFPHHPYLDLLPFPALRERAITLAGMFNAMDLKLDVFREGLTCSPSARNNEYLGNNQPWDVRSWEVKPWFWKKWRLLMDSSAAIGGKVIDGVDDSGTVISVI